MIRPYRAVQLLIAGAAAAVFSSPALACRCENLTRAQAIARADLVFEGRVLRVRTERDSVYADIETLRPLKGSVPRRIEVGSRRSAAACGVIFKQGQRSVFAVSFAEQQFTANSCLMNAVNGNR